MIKVKVGSNVFYYDSTADVYSDYPDAIYISGHFIAEEKEEEQ